MRANERYTSITQQVNKQTYQDCELVLYNTHAKDVNSSIESPHSAPAAMHQTRWRANERYTSIAPQLNKQTDQDTEPVLFNTHAKNVNSSIECPHSAPAAMHQTRWRANERYTSIAPQLNKQTDQNSELVLYNSHATKDANSSIECPHSTPAAMQQHLQQCHTVQTTLSPDRPLTRRMQSLLLKI